MTTNLPDLPTLALGRYRHYKGGHYEVVGVVRHSESLEPLVLYRPLDNNTGLWVRPLAMFVEHVVDAGQTKPRFSKVEGTAPTHPKPSAVIFANDVDRLAAFYRDVTRMTEVLRDAEHVVLDGGVHQLVIHSIPPSIAARITIASPPQVREDTPIKLCLPVASIDAARRTAAQLGGAVEPPSREWSARGFRACDGHDPEGHVFQLREAGA
jgi:predicted enzyme related to lactoylglutathione lyase